MATPYKLVRNSRVFFTNAVDSAGVVLNTVAATDTFELRVLDGFSFSQATTQSTIQLSEAGNTPTRGQRSFNTALNPVEFSFSTYTRPGLNGAVVSADESVLWNALLSDTKILAANAKTVAAGTGFTRVSTATNVCTMTFTALDVTAIATSAAGDILSISGMTGNYAKEFNQPALVVFTPNLTAATTATISYLNVPSVAAGTTSAGAATLSFAKYAWTTNAQAGVAATAATYNAANAQVHSGQSNRNQLQKFGLIIQIDDIMYAIDNCVLDQASVDFGLDAIAMVAWTGKGTGLRKIATAGTIASNAAAFGSNAWTGGTITGASYASNQTAPYIMNKLSTMNLTSKIYGTDGAAGTDYVVAITGGNLTIANNVNYITPANLGVVNAPAGYFTGTRSISGNVTAYLKTGASAVYTADLLSQILTANLAETKFKVQLEVGGASNPVHVDFLMNGAMLQVPTIATADLMTTTINFTAQGYDPIAASQAFDIGQTNDVTIKYYSA